MYLFFILIQLYIYTKYEGFELNVIHKKNNNLISNSLFMKIKLKIFNLQNIITPSCFVAVYI